MPDKIPVTVVIPVRNEAANLPRCLAALDRYDEVVVVDSASTDATAEIARGAGVRVVHFAWEGRYPKKRNWFLMNHTARHPWILFLDADEVVNPAFDAEVERAVADAGKVGYWIEFDNYFQGALLRHGVVQRKLALFRPAAGRYERIDDERWSHLDMEVHEHPVLDGDTGTIARRIEHRDLRGMEKFLLQHVEYAKWEARRYANVMGAEVDTAHFTQRQRAKYRNLTRWWFPYAYFLFAYVMRRGFLDGRAGFDYAAYKLWYFKTVAALIREQREPSRGGHGA